MCGLAKEGEREGERVREGAGERVREGAGERVRERVRGGGARADWGLLGLF